MQPVAAFKAHGLVKHHRVLSDKPARKYPAWFLTRRCIRIEDELDTHNSMPHWIDIHAEDLDFANHCCSPSPFDWIRYSASVLTTHQTSCTAGSPTCATKDCLIIPEKERLYRYQWPAQSWIAAPVAAKEPMATACDTVLKMEPQSPIAKTPDTVVSWKGGVVWMKPSCVRVRPSCCTNGLSILVGGR